MARWKTDSLLEVEHLTMRFGGLVAINDLSFTVGKGDITALIGPNGAGKTTVFNCITGFYKPTEGRIARRSGPSCRAPPPPPAAAGPRTARRCGCSSACPTSRSPPTPTSPAPSRTSACSPA
jgi:branched-chain amino acid transport system ATP-binding protein